MLRIREAWTRTTKAASSIPPGTFFRTAALWVHGMHGHRHSSSDYVHHRTRMVADPRGYVRRAGAVEKRAFKADLVVAIEAAQMQLSGAQDD